MLIFHRRFISGFLQIFTAYLMVNRSFAETATYDCNTASPIVSYNTTIANTIEKSATVCRKCILVFEGNSSDSGE